MVSQTLYAHWCKALCKCCHSSYEEPPPPRLGSTHSGEMAFMSAFLLWRVNLGKFVDLLVIIIYIKRCKTYYKEKVTVTTIFIPVPCVPTAAVAFTRGGGLALKFSVFSLTLARSPMASRSHRRASDFLNYSPGLASDILVERKSEKKKKNFFLKKLFPQAAMTLGCQKLI